MLKPSRWMIPILFGAYIVPAASPEPKPSTTSHDWPQWLGPLRNGHSQEIGLLPTWPKGGPHLLWKAGRLGAGFSTPAIAGGRIFTMGNRGGKEYVIAVSEKEGTPLWKTAIGPVRHKGGGYPGPRCTPAVDGERVIVLGLNGDLVCLTAARGKTLWRKKLRKHFGGKVGTWGFSESPLIDGDKVICTPGGKKVGLAALDKRTGKTIWKARVPHGGSAAYASVIAIEVEGQRQYVQFMTKGVVGVSAASGKFLWRYDKPANGNANCSTAVFADGLLFAASGYGTGGGLVRLSRKEGRTRAKEVYFTKTMKNHHGGMVLVDGHLYGCNDPGMLVCLEFATGKVKWKERRPGKGCLAYADGRLYYRQEDGRVYLIEANPRRYVERGSFKQAGRSSSPAWSYPVIANGRLYIRDQDSLFCFAIARGPGQGE